MSKRDRIVKELIRRLEVEFPSTHVIEGSGGIWGEWRGILPVFHIYENETDYVLHGNGLYRVTFPIQIEFVIRLNDRRKLYSEGRTWLKKLQSAIELDERFTEAESNEDLCVGFSLDADEIVEVIDQVMDVAVLYSLEYVDSFLGYEPHRH